MAKYMAIDFGLRRVGIAVSDELGMLARPLTAIDRRTNSSPCESISLLAQENEISEIVIGYPISLNGSAGQSAMEVDKFIEELSKVCPQKIIKWDERFTSVQALKNMQVLGIKTKGNKERVDKMAACFILQDFLDAISRETIPD
jgi:putative holliday junction resolvase